MARFKHILIWKLLRFPAFLFLKIRFNYSFEKAPKIPGPFLLISNHVTDLDPLMVGCSFSQQMYFVASEHLFRKGFLSRLLVWLVAPIARIKGSTDTASAMNIIRTLRRRGNVGLFAEGDRSWNGLTSSLHPTTARLIKAAKATLVTYRLSGGYMTSPRWSRIFPRGRMYGRYINIYSPERLERMSVGELTEAVMCDIYEDAYERQRKEHIAYKGPRLAEGLELAIYTCPVCKGVCTTHSKEDLFYCDCGMQASYNVNGFFEGELRPFDTIRDWDAWQEDFLRKYALKTGTNRCLRTTGRAFGRSAAITARNASRRAR
jgi:1-acyl-sn-glycerol-3-phosphate acyltransferase